MIFSELKRIIIPSYMVTLRCPYASTTFYDLRSLYKFVIVCTFTNFKHRKTVAGHCAGAVWRLCDDHAITAIVGRPQGLMPSWLYLPRSLYDFSVRDFLPTIFRHTSQVIKGYDVCAYNLYEHHTISCSGSLRCSGSEPYDQRDTVGKS